MTEPTPTLTEANSLAMRLAVVYYTPLGWDLLDGDDVDPDDLAQCLQAMRPVVAEVETILATARADERGRALTEAADAWDANEGPGIPTSRWLRHRAALAQPAKVDQ